MKRIKLDSDKIDELTMKMLDNTLDDHENAYDFCTLHAGLAIAHMACVAHVAKAGGGEDATKYIYDDIKSFIGSVNSMVFVDDEPH